MHRHFCKGMSKILEKFLCYLMSCQFHFSQPQNYMHIKENNQKKRRKLLKNKMQKKTQEFSFNIYKVLNDKLINFLNVICTV